MSDERTPRAVRIAQITAAIELGLSTKEISAWLGLSKTTVRGYVTDPNRTRDYQRRMANSRPCPACGGPTNGSKIVSICIYCKTGRRNPGLPDPNAPYREMRVTDVSAETLAQALYDACCQTPDEDERYELLAAAVWPSEQRHRVPA